MDTFIHVVLSSDNNYAGYLGVTVFSVLKHAEEEDRYHFHILDGGLSPENKELLSSMVREKGGVIDFIAVSAEHFSGLNLQLKEENHVNIATYYRLLIPSLIQEERCIYMDCDMICRKSLRTLQEYDFAGKMAAAVRDIDEDKQSVRLGLQRYFNAGLFVMNLSAMRREGIQQQFFEFLKHNADRVVMHDQDVLNCVLHGRIAKLDKRWNVQVAFTRKCRETGFLALGKTAHVIHYVGHHKPWKYDKKCPYQLTWLHYLLQSPFIPLQKAVPWLLRCKYRIARKTALFYV